MDESAIETVFVAGASGKTGRQILQLLDGRVRVRALTRSPARRVELRATGADEVVVDDLLEPSDLAGALEGVDAVLSAVGSGVRDILRPGPLVDGAGTKALLRAAIDADVDAFVMESALGVGDEPASPMGVAFDAMIGPIQRAKADAEAAIREAPLRYTVFRPGILTDGQRTDDVTVADPGAKLWGIVPRADVAHLMAAAPVTDAAADRTFETVARPHFRNRALDIDWQLPGR